MMYAGKQRRGKNDGLEKARDVKYVLKRLMMYLTYYKSKLILAIFLSILSNVLSLIGPFLTGRTISAMENGVDFKKIFYYAGLMIIFYLISTLMNYLLSKQMIKISQSVIYKMRKDLFEKLNSVPVAYFDKNQTGDIISKMSYDIDTINTSLANDVINIITSFITVIISFIMMIIMSPILVLIFLGTIPISIIVTRLLSKIVKKKYRIRNQMLGELNGFSEEMITGQKTVQSYVQEESVLEKFKDINKKTKDASYESGYYSTTVGPTVNFISNLSVALVGVFGGILYFKNLIDLGKLTSFTLYSRRFSGPINQMSNILADIQSALAAAERVFLVLDEDDEAHDKKDAYSLEKTNGKIEFKNVNFEYVKNTPVLKDVNLYANPGQVVAIVGPTGAGKTTLVNLLMRFYDINSGKILLDNIDTLDIVRKDLRRSYSMVLQDTWIFHGTVYENVSYGNSDVTLEKVIDACKKAKIHNFIMHLEDGYNTLLTEEGTQISKGQKQLLVVARAMLSNTNMLILDEATSNVDTHTEVLIQSAMLDLMKNKTAFVIAHRLSTIENADLILVIKDGNIIEKGTHKSLLAKKGFYHELYFSQFN